MVVAFYKGRTRLYNKLVSWWLVGPYSHVELVLGYDEAGLAICASSSMMDNGVRIKHMELNPEHWDFIELPNNLPTAWAWLEEHQREGYDYLGAAGFIARVLGQTAKRSFCSEAVAEMLGLSEAWRFDPCSLHAVLTWSAPQDVNISNEAVMAA